MICFLVVMMRSLFEQQQGNIRPRICMIGYAGMIGLLTL